MREICGATVIFKVMLEVYKTMHKNINPVLDTLDIVATATIADVMPLIGVNRYIVKAGLKQISEEKRPFFRSHIRCSYAGKLSARDLAFQIAPMINAVSRLDKDVFRLQCSHGNHRCRCSQALQTTQRIQRRTKRNYSNTLRKRQLNS